jgi:superfamily I DNA/RNA helicase
VRQARGKTHNLVGRAGEIVQDGALGEGHKLLALTFMNGARRRLDARLGENPAFRRRFDWQTFDVFARTLAARRRSLVTQAMQAEADALSEFDGPCALAAGLLQIQAVQKWVARSFPLILVDEAQDLDDHRMRILQGLSPSCRIVAAADAFQCLHNGRDTTPLWAGLKARAKHTASRWFGAQPSRAFWPPRWQCAKAGM